MIKAIKIITGGIIWGATAGSAIVYVANVVWPALLVALIVGMHAMALAKV